MTSEQTEDSVMTIKVRQDVDAQELRDLGVHDWPIWEKEVSTFPWTYDMEETAYILAGEVKITPQGQSEETVTLQKGDLVIFPAGLSCTWEVLQPIRKHFNFD